MVLNIFPRPKKVTMAPDAEPQSALPEPSIEALDELEPKKRPTRRGSRGGRGRSKSADESAAEAPSDPGAAVIAASATDGNTQPAVRRTNRQRATSAAGSSHAAPAEGSDHAPDEASVVAGKAPRTTRTPKREAAPADTAEAPAGKAPTTQAAMLRAIEQQSHQIEQLIRLQEDAARRGGSHAATAAPPPPRVGVFVDSANIELACDRLKTRFDWKKILDMLTRDRQLVRAIAYSPVHDDPGVSIETQRFVEPFLGKGYKVFTKPLKRFQDNTIKANVDIELALDVMEMIDRLDVVCLVSGDGDFQRLVEVVQTKGVQVEVVAVGASTASQLRHAADHYIDLQQRLKEIRA